MRIRTSDGRECDITKAQWDLVYSGDGSVVIEPDPVAVDPPTGSADTAETTAKSRTAK